MSRSEDLETNLLPFANIRINGSRSWDIQVHDKRFFFRVMAVGTLGFGESYMDGRWECEAAHFSGDAFQSSAGSMTDRGPVPVNQASASLLSFKYASQNAVESARITR